MHFEGICGLEEELNYPLISTNGFIFFFMNLLSNFSIFVSILCRQGQQHYASDKLLETLTNVLFTPKDVQGLGYQLGFSHSAVEKYLNRPDSTFNTVSRSGFDEMLRDWRRRVRPGDQVDRLRTAMKDARLGYAADILPHGRKYHIGDWDGARQICHLLILYERFLTSDGNILRQILLPPKFSLISYSLHKQCNLTWFFSHNGLYPGNKHAGRCWSNDNYSTYRKNLANTALGKKDQAINCNYDIIQFVSVVSNPMLPLNSW